MSDKRKNIAAQKLEAQRRLFRPSKRVTDTADVTEFEKKRLSIERRKEELVNVYFFNRARLFKTNIVVKISNFNI